MALNEAKFTINYEAEQVPAMSEFSLDARTALSRAASFLEALGAGMRVGSVAVLTNNGNAAAATGEVEFDGTSGTTTVTINGVAFSQTSGTDAERAAAAAAAINASANALIDGVVTATDSNGVLTILADVKGKSGNWITLAASGTGVTASGNRLTGGSEATNGVTVTR